jgi:hypothetical protein
MAHFVPTMFDQSASELIGLAASRIVKPVVCNEPLVETSMIESQHGTVVVLTNWSGKPRTALEVTFRGTSPGSKASLASGTKLVTERNADHTLFTFDLDVADVLILR